MSYDDDKTIQAEKKEAGTTYKILNKEPTYTKKPDESVEAFMARIKFGGLSILPAGKQFVDMDGNGDGKLTPTEAKNALDSAPLKDAIPKPQRDRMYSIAQNAEGKGLLADIDRIAAQLKQTIKIRREDGSSFPAEKGNITDEDLKILDKNNDGKVSIGEFEYKVLNDQLKDGDTPNNKLPRKKQEQQIT